MINGHAQENGCGMTGLSPGVQKCKDKFSLWKHFRTQHQDRYLHYCAVKDKWDMDEISTLPQHIRKVHKRKPASDVAVHALVCPKCKQHFAQKHKLDNHILFVVPRTVLLPATNVIIPAGVPTS